MKIFKLTCGQAEDSIIFSLHADGRKRFLRLFDWFMSKGIMSKSRFVTNR